MLYPIIMCGGYGTRLWPLSRKSFPKQFTKILSEQSLFQQTVLRTIGFEYSNPTIVTCSDYRFIATEQLAEIEIKPLATLIEPEAKNTAPAILAAAIYIYQMDSEATLLIMPSDHVINDINLFKSAANKVRPYSEIGNIITFGIKPNFAHTGYGYLELSDENGTNIDNPTLINRFIEKPDIEAASKMFLSNKYLWNSGIFMFKARTIIDAFNLHEPLMSELVLKSLTNSKIDLGFTRLDSKYWSQIIPNSIDYAIMEKVDNIVAMPYKHHWTDLGSWEAVWDEMGKDANGNAVSNNANTLDCTNTLLRSESEDLEIVGIGLDDIIAIATKDAVIVAKKNDSQRVGEAVKLLNKNSKKQAEQFPIKHRPWGWYESLSCGDNFQVKRICIKPMSSISLQSHSKRAEHWIIVSGTAKVTIGDDIKIMSANQSIYIPIGEKHRIENNNDIEVILIEVQTGDYLGEDDIIRYKDEYSREQNKL